MAGVWAGKIALITGAGPGIGRASARALKQSAVQVLAAALGGTEDVQSEKGVA